MSEMSLEELLRLRLGDDLGPWEIVASDSAGSYKLRLPGERRLSEAARLAHLAMVRLSDVPRRAPSLIEVQHACGWYPIRLV